MVKKVKFMCTAFRDGFQSVYGARVLTKDFLPALEAARDAGIRYFEAGGGARFQALYFYCNEDAFAMMDAFRETVGPDANLQTLSRGVNVVGLESQSSDIIRLHAELFKKHGITTIRNFDALNDVENLIYSGQCIVEAGLKHQVCVTMMELPPGCTGAHDPDFYEMTLRKIVEAEIPFDSVCFKDASGTSVPATVYETIRRARKMLPRGTFIHFHTHETAGIGVSANRAALDAGADAIDLSLAPCSGGTCQPDVLVMWHALRHTEYELDVDVEKVMEAEEVFKECMRDYFLPPEATAVEPMIPWSPLPGGALTANTQMLRDHGIMDKYPEMIKGMGEVVRRGGFGTSVTPVSQFYIQQAFNNVLFGPWKRIAEPYGRMVLGYFGKTPVPPDPEIVRLAARQLQIVPADQPPLVMNDADPNKGVMAARRLLRSENLPETDENIFIAATCKEKGIAVLKGKGQIGVRKIDPNAAPADVVHVSDGPTEYTVSVDGKKYTVSLAGHEATVEGKTYEIEVDGKKPSLGGGGGVPQAAPSHAAPAPKKIAGTDVRAHMPGVVLRYLCSVGDTVAAGEGILVLEAMKMEVQITAPGAGTVVHIAALIGDHVSPGQVLATVGT